MSKVKSIKYFLLIAAVLFTTAFAGWGPVVHATPAITSDFRQVNAGQITAEMGAGWNLGNVLELSNNGAVTADFSNLSKWQSLLQSVKAAGFKTVRIPVSYLNKIGPAPNYTIDATWMSGVKSVIDYAYNLGLYVITNVHQDGYTSVTGSWLLCGSTDQTTIKAKYQAVWQQIANTFVNYNEHLIFESMNEEFDGTWSTPDRTHYANINAYNQIFVDTVRQTGGNNSARWLLIPGWNTNIDYTAGNYGFVMPADNYRSSTVPSSEKRIMVSVHYYSPWDFCGDESKTTITQWGATATDPSRKSSGGQEDYMNTEFQSMYNTFRAQGYGVIIGEYGSIDKTYADSTNNTYRAAFAKTVCSTAKKYNLVPVYWDNGWNGNNGFALFDRSTYAVTQQGIVNAIMGVMSTLRFKNVTTGLFIDGMGRTTDGSNAGQWSDSTSYNQKWILEVSGNYVKLKNAATGLYLDGMYRTTAGSVCGQWSSSTSYNQNWTIEMVGTNYRFKNASTGLYLDGGGSTTNGADLKQWTDATSTNLQWQLVP